MSSFHFRGWFSGARNLRAKGSVTCLGTVFQVRLVLATLLVAGSWHSYVAPLLNDLTFCESKSLWVGSKDGVVVIALASHLRARVRASCGLSWLLVLYSAPRGFSPGSPVFPSPQKSTFPNSNLIGCRTSLKTTFRWVELPLVNINIYYFIIYSSPLFILFIIIYSSQLFDLSKHIL